VRGFLRGEVHVMFDTLPETVGHIKDGKLRPLGVTAAPRQTALPDVPALREFLPGYEASGWYGIVAPAATPVDVLEGLNKEINAALADPKIEAHLADLGAVAFPGSPAAFGEFIAVETQKWAKVVNVAGLKAE